MSENVIWVNAVPTIIGGAIGIIGSLSTSIYLENSKRKAERRSFTGAIIGEISALIEISERRHYIQGIRQSIEKAKAQTNPDIGYNFYFSVRRNSFAVYDANLSRLGILESPLPQLIVRFYTQTSAILEDIADMRENKMKRNRDESIQTLEALLKLFEDTHSLGKEIIALGSK